MGVVAEACADARVMDGVGFDGRSGRVADSFGFVADGPLGVYGRADAGQVTDLAFTSPHALAERIPELERLMREFDLMLVNWCAAEAWSADE
jgi:hypothetical protein